MNIESSVSKPASAEYAQSSRSKIKDSPGFVSGFSFSPADLSRLRDIITARWLGRIRSVARPELADQFLAIGIERYHDHGSLWNKDARLFSKEDVQEIWSMSLFKDLILAFGPLTIADIEGLGYPEIYWRLVRPNNPQDVSGVHADSWFYTYTNDLTPEHQANLIKIWVAIFVAPGESGLKVMVDSHRSVWPHHSEIRHGRSKPVLDVAESGLDLKVVATRPGEAIAFNIDLLHGGVAHVCNQTRVSIEFAVRSTSANT
jgi:hypothetical protein